MAKIQNNERINKNVIRMTSLQETKSAKNPRAILERAKAKRLLPPSK
jgi:hypothetical protein